MCMYKPTLTSRQYIRYIQPRQTLHLHLYTSTILLRRCSMFVRFLAQVDRHTSNERKKERKRGIDVDDREVGRKTIWKFYFYYFRIVTSLHFISRLRMYYYRYRVSAYSLSKRRYGVVTKLFAYLIRRFFVKT